jgi:NADPH:quinone reductase-like Zn-dependent oxidoreductase
VKALAVFREPMPRIRAESVARVTGAELGVLNVGFLCGAKPTFDPDRPENRSKVAIRVRAFACNYRDKVLLARFLHGNEEPSLFIGSDFVADVITVGRHVSGLSVGDRVIGNNHYPDSLGQGIRPGIPTNHASQCYLELNELQLTRVTPTLSDVEAAAFSVCAQTCYSILRRVAPRPGERGLVTAATSGTSLCLLRALREYDVSVYAVSATLAKDRDLSRFGVAGTIRLGQDGRPSSNEMVKALRRRGEQLDFIIDPFADLYLPELLNLLAYGGRYVTCGFLGQSGAPIQGRYVGELPIQPFLETVITRNLSIMGHCLGSQDDLKQALDEHAAGRFDLVIDSVFSGAPAGEFVHRSFVSQERFGRVVYSYV